jgi:hypothetical protein
MGRAIVSAVAASNRILRITFLPFDGAVWQRCSLQIKER